MKKGRFLWSAHRITEKQKTGKARNIKEKQLKNSRSTASKPRVVHLSSPRDNWSRFTHFTNQKALTAAKSTDFAAVFYKITTIRPMGGRDFIP